MKNSAEAANVGMQRRCYAKQKGGSYYGGIIGQSAIFAAAHFQGQAAQAGTGAVRAFKAEEKDYFNSGELHGRYDFKNDNRYSRCKYGAVSYDTALQMAQGVKKISGSDIGISTTGIAGPGGGSADKPVGLVYIGYSDSKTEDCVRLELWDVTATRDEVRNLAAAAAILTAYKSNLNK